MTGNYPYHKSCYKEHYHPKCDVFKYFILTNTAGLIEYRSHPFWIQKYCPSHEHDGTSWCCSCVRMEDHAVRFKILFYCYLHDTQDGSLSSLHCNLGNEVTLICIRSPAELGTRVGDIWSMRLPWACAVGSAIIRQSQNRERMLAEISFRQCRECLNVGFTVCVSFRNYPQIMRKVYVSLSGIVLLVE